MIIFTNLILYICILSVVWFITLPFGLSNQKNAQKVLGADGGAPSKNYLGWKVLAAAVGSFLIWLVIYVLTDGGDVAAYLLDP